MPGYDPKRPRRTESAEEPAPVDALIDIAEHAGVERAEAEHAADRGVAGRSPGSPELDGGPVVPEPASDDPTARVVLALVAVAVVLALVGTILARRRMHRRREG